MNILFLTLSKIYDIEQRGIYMDLVRKFRDNGHSLYIVTPLERREKKNTVFYKSSGVSILGVKILNIREANFIEKGIGTILIEYQYYKAIKKNLADIVFDLILYSTPPISFTKVIKKIKKEYKATSYLLLKDIFPQNAVDLGLIKRNGLLHLYFRRKEKKLYDVSDYIGCMSPANVEYIKKQNPQIGSAKTIEVCPNSISPIDFSVNDETKFAVREKWGIPQDKTVFVYGGNLGKPQGLDFLSDVLESNKKTENCFFLIVGSGTEYAQIEAWLKNAQIENVKLLKKLPKSEYDLLIQACDIGLIFLDKRFTIPNYPSRLLPYLEFKMPVLAATDTNTDIGKIAEANSYGFWCENGDLDKFNHYLNMYANSSILIHEMGNNGYRFLMENYTVTHTYNVIMSHFI